ncbi:MAG: hypothetical protein KA129_00770, partial [Microthrixaceae bacterium]|nr:hypothetical protein [Microthrixaceae bacterium]
MASRSEREVKIRFTGESAVLKGSAGEVRKVFQMLTSDLNDSRGAGEKLAAAYEQVADSMRKDMAAIAETADVVRDSLGPEMTQAIEASGRTVEDQVQEWRKLGLTLDDITRDSDQLAAGLKQLDDSARMSAGAVGDGFKKVADNSDRARSNAANFAGNMASELPLVSGALGPLNVGIGQMVEGLAEGAINWKQLLGVGLAMGAATMVLAELTDNSDDLAEAQRKAMRAELVKSWVDALQGAASPIDSLAEQIAGVGMIVGELDTTFGRAGVDMTAWFREAGLSVTDWTTAIAGGEAGAADLEAKIRGSSLTAQEQTTIMLALGNAQEVYATSSEGAATQSAVFGEQLADTTDEVDRGSDSLVQNMDATTRNTLARESLTTATERAEEAQRDLNAAQLAGIDTGYAVADAQDRFTESMEALAIATDDPATGVNELDQAQRSAEQSALAMAQANVANAEAMAIAAGAPLSAAESNYKLIESLNATVMTLDENSPVRAALLGHIGTLQGVQANVATTVTADTEQAQEDIGKVLTDAEKLNTETDTKANAETTTALDAVQTLTTAVEGVPNELAISVKLSGVSSAIAD